MPLIPFVLAAEPPTQARCTEAYVSGQHLMRGGHLLDALSELLVCARDPCSATYRPECVAWLADVQRSLPSVVVGAHGSRGQELRSVHVRVDGRPYLDELDGTAKDIDPGDHVFRLEASGETPIEDHVIVRQGEKSRVLAFQFPTTGSPPQRPEPHAGPNRLPAWVLGGVGVVALGAFAYFGLNGLSLWNDCHQGCTQSHDDRGNLDWIAADVSLGVAVVSLGLATYFFVRKGESGPSVGVTAVPGGGGAWVGGRF
jgi:hypothetical protein